MQVVRWTNENGKDQSLTITGTDAWDELDAAQAAWDQLDAPGWNTMRTERPQYEDDHAQRMQRLSDGVRLAMHAESPLALI